MKKYVKRLPDSPQLEKRKFAIQLIKKKISKPDVIRMANICERSYKRYVNLIKKKGFEGAAERNSRSRAASKLTKARKISIMNSLRANPFQSTRELADRFHGRIHYSTIYRYLISSGFTKKYPGSHFHLEDGDADERVKFAKSLRNFVGMAAIVFVDETSIWLNENNLPGWFHKDKKNPLSIEKHLGKVHMCAGISCFGKVFAVTFRNNLNSTTYSKIMRQHLIPSANRLYPYGWWLAQDNGPTHLGDALPVKYFEVPYYLVWPARSPDLNPIENLWSEIKRNVRKRLPRTVDELEQFVLEEWEKIPYQSIKNYSESFEDRLKAVIKSNGEKIDY